MDRVQGPYEDYLGDGLYADFDGYQILLSANGRVGECTDKVALEPGVLSAFIRYINRLREQDLPI